MKRTQAILVTVALTGALVLTNSTIQAQSAQRGLDATVYIDVARDVLPSVVNITIEPRTRANRAANDPDQLRRLFEEEGSGFRPFGTVSGSGVVVDRRDNVAFVVTNNHVVSNISRNQQIRLTFHRRSETTNLWDQTTEIVGDNVRVLGTDSLSDLAVIEFDIPEGFDPRPIAFGDSDRLEVGENVVALGNPLDLNHTVTRGIISGKGRDLGQRISIERLLQTDAVIQPGNSGGPLVNLDGHIIGINNAIASRSGFWQGTGFAIPGNDVRRTVEQIINNGRVARGYMGVNMLPLERNVNLARVLGLEDLQGVIIDRIVSESPADIAGIIVNDVVVRIDGERVGNSEQMLQMIARRTAGDVINVEVVRLMENDEPGNLTFQVRLAERPPEPMLAEMHRERGTDREPRLSLPGAPPPEPAHDRQLGLALENYLDSATRTPGLRITSVRRGSVAEIAGLEVGDIILTVNGLSVSSIGDFRAALSSNADDGSHILRIVRNGRESVVRVFTQQRPTTPRNR